MYYHDEKGNLHGLPVRWTSLGAPDSFVAIAAGRSLFRVSDLLELVEWIGRQGR